MNCKVDEYFNGATSWREELIALREIMQACDLTETFKWMHPCYTHKNKNIVLIHEFKQYCALLFHKGALLKDEQNLLVRQTENVQAQRQMRFNNIEQIKQATDTIKATVAEAIDVELSGRKVEKKILSDYDVPEELKRYFYQNASLESAFEQLTPGRQKGYLLHFSQPKQSQIRMARIDKNLERIMNGKGLNDCVCGHSKKMPACDGSHKFVNLK